MKLLTVGFGFLMISVGSAIRMNTFSHYQEEEAEPAAEPAAEPTEEPVSPSIDELADDFQKTIFAEFDDNADGKI